MSTPVSVPNGSNERRHRDSRSVTYSLVDSGTAYKTFNYDGVELQAWENPYPPTKDKKKWLGRGLRFVPFWFVASLSLVVLGCFPLWMYLDAHYRGAMPMVQINLGLNRISADPFATEVGLTDLVLGFANDWDHFGARISLFYLLFLLAIISGVFLLLHLWHHRTYRRICVICCLAALWVGLFLSHSQLTHWAVEHHARKLLPKVKFAAFALTTQWPVRSGQIPPNINFLVSPKEPNFLMVHGEMDYASWRESLSDSIERLENGTICFLLFAAPDYNIEYHPNGSLPSSYTSSLGDDLLEMSEWTQLEENWYLVRYGEGLK